MRTLVPVAVVLGLCAVTAVAGPFDGVYVAHSDAGAPDWSGCAALDILIADDRVRYFDVDCSLTAPVQIRDMDALLFDGQCTLDGRSKAGRVLIRRMETGDVMLVTPFMDVRLAGCEVAG
ncbi:MAG: hypothetical protein R3D59_15215 [Paracoccaceae bacterium]